MPILNQDRFRDVFFDHVQCPENVVVPVKDYDAYRQNPKFRWAYNKLVIAEMQGLSCGPHGVSPDEYPVFSKPIYNMNSMGAGTMIILNQQEYIENRRAGHMWSTLLRGDHISTDVAILKGKSVWMSHTRGYPLKGGTFDYWEANILDRGSLTEYTENFVRLHFQGYTGMMNLESIGGKFIEIHLRFSDQWPDLYFPGFMESVVGLYSGHWPRRDACQKTGYSVILFATSESECWIKPCEMKVRQLKENYDILSIQLSITDGLLSCQHSMPPGGFRLAIVNGFDLKSCFIVREKLAKLFASENTSNDFSVLKATIQT